MNSHKVTRPLFTHLILLWPPDEIISNQISSSFVKAGSQLLAFELWSRRTHSCLLEVSQLILSESKPNPEIRRASSSAERHDYAGRELEKNKLFRGVTMHAVVAVAELQRSCLQMEGGVERSAISAALNHLVFM